MNDIIYKLKSDGWHINDCKLNSYLESQEIQPRPELIKQLIYDTDIRKYGDSWMDVCNKNELQCNGVVQINKIRNVSAPEIDQENKNHPAMFKYLISDGVNSIFLLDLKSNSKFSEQLQLGGKVILRGTIPIRCGMMLLQGKSASVKYLGGKVLDLIKAESSTKIIRTNARGDGPPKFLPFGNKLNIDIQAIKNFKTLIPETNGSQDEVGSTEFDHKRDAEIEKVKREAADTSDKADLLTKFQSGGRSTFMKNTIEKRDRSDDNLAALLSQGFTLGEAKRALGATKNNLHAAIDFLLDSNTKANLHVTEDTPSPRGRHNRSRGRGKGDFETEDDPWFDPVMYAERVGLASRPQTTMSLADYLGPAATAAHVGPLNSTPSRQSLIGRGYQCQAQVMDGSYKAAVVLEVLPGRCLRIRYLVNGEETETGLSGVRGQAGERLHDHMVPNVAEPPPRQQQHSYSAGGGYFRGGRGGGPPRRGRGGDRYRRGRY